MTQEIDISKELALPEFSPNNIAPERGRILLRRQELMGLLKQGVRKQTELAAALGVSVCAIRSDLDAIEKEYSELAQGVQGIRDMEKMLAWERYQEVMYEFAQVRQQMMEVIRMDGADLNSKIKAADVHAKAGEKFMLGQDKINKLLGLNAPTKHSLTDPTGEQDRGGMNDELREKILRERKELEEIRRQEEENTVDAEIIEDDDSGKEQGSGEYVGSDGGGPTSSAGKSFEVVSSERGSDAIGS